MADHYVYDGFKYHKNYAYNNKTYPEAAVEIPFASIESTMYRWRKELKPPQPKSIEEYNFVLNDPKWNHILTYNDGSMECNYVQEEGFKVVIFYDTNFLKLIADAAEANIDATFKCVPSGIGLGNSAQLLTIMVTKYNHSLPCFWSLMNRRTTAAYMSVFNKFRERTTGMNIINIMCDFEKPLYRSLQNVFPDSAIHGCFFHYCQALLRKCGKLGLITFIKEREDAKITLKKLMALALLPTNNISQLFSFIKDDCAPDVKNAFRELFVYFEKTWLEDITCQMFSVYNLPRRTNNAVESYHRYINRTFKTHPNVWHFTQELVKKQACTHSDLKTLEKGKRTTRSQKLKYVINSKNISSAWKNLASENITALEFLENAKHFLDTFVNNYFHVEEDLQVNEVIDNTVPETMGIDDEVVLLADFSNSREIEMVYENERGETVPTGHQDSEPELQLGTENEAEEAVHFDHNDTQLQLSTQNEIEPEDNQINNFIELRNDEYGVDNIGINELQQNLSMETQNAVPSLHGHEVLYIDRQNILQQLLNYYENVHLSDKEVTVVFNNENGSDFGGLKKEMYTLFWKEAEEHYFIGEDCKVPYLPLHRYRKEKEVFQVIGRILDHSFCNVHNFPNSISKCVILNISNSDREIPSDLLIEDFLNYVSQYERQILSKSLHFFDQLTENEIDFLLGFFSSNNFFEVPKVNEIREQIK